MKRLVKHGEKGILYVISRSSLNLITYYRSFDINDENFSLVTSDRPIDGRDMRKNYYSLNLEIYSRVRSYQKYLIGKSQSVINLPKPNCKFNTLFTQFLINFIQNRIKISKKNQMITNFLIKIYK